MPNKYSAPVGNMSFIEKRAQLLTLPQEMEKHLQNGTENKSMKNQ